MVMDVIELPTIYKKTSTGKTQHWTIEIHGNKYRTISGQVGGKSIKSKFTECKAKSVGKVNETTPEEQALKDATNKRNIKLSEEYKETEEECTGDVGYVKPMLAKDYNDYKDDIVFPVYSDKKYNGMRCIITANGMFSRNGKMVVSAPHILANCKSLFVAHPTLVLDGELYNHKLRHKLNRLIQLVRRTKPTAEELAESEKIVEYHVYDGYGWNSIGGLITNQTVFSTRKAGLGVLIRGLKKIFFVESDLVNNQEELDAFYKAYQAAEYEGQMVRKDVAYENKRTDALLKRKDFMDKEFKVLEFIEGEGNKAGMVGAVWLELPEPVTMNGETWTKFKSNLKGDNTYSKQVWEHRQYLLGQMATTKFFEYTEYKIPQFPYIVAFRPSIDCD